MDGWDVRGIGHRETAKRLGAEHRVTPWWRQTITVRYEQERGIREPGRRSTGDFRLDVSRTINVTAERAYDAFTDPRAVSSWFTTKHKADLRVGGRYRNADGDTGEFRLLDRPRRLRFTWENAGHCPGTMVDVRFEPKGTASAGGRTTVRLEHSKLRSKKDLEDMRGGWSWAMDSLKSFLETGKPIRHEDWLAARAK
jgi:uncharacterized protein YndB with AHSA1/START domain